LGLKLKTQIKRQLLFLKMIKPDKIKHIAKLANLKLSQNEIKQYCQDIGSILDYARQLQDIDIEKIKPITHTADVKNVLRNDNPIKNTAVASKTYFKTKKIIEK